MRCPGASSICCWHITFVGTLIKLGVGKLPESENDEIKLLPVCVSDSNLADEVLGKHISLAGVQNRCVKVVLCPKHGHALMVNEQVLQQSPGTEKGYTSVDEEDVSNYPTECFASLTSSETPLHQLSRNIGPIVTLLRNLNVHQGLCNGTRLIVRQLHSHTIDCEVETGLNKGNQVLIPMNSINIFRHLFAFQVAQASVSRSPLTRYDNQ